MAYVPNSGSVVSYQIVPSSLLTGASIFGLPPVNLTALNGVGLSVGAGNQGTGTIRVVQADDRNVTTVAPSGSIMATNQVAGSILATSAVAPAGSIISSTAPAGSIMAVSTPANFPTGTALEASSASVVVMGLRNSAGNSFYVGGVSDSADSLATNGNGNDVRTGALGFVFNGGTWDRLRGNSSVGAVVTTGASSVNTLQLAGSIMAVSATAPSGSIMTTAQVAGSLLGVTVKSGSVISNAPAGSILAVTIVSGSTLTFAPAGSIMSVTTPAGSIMSVTGPDSPSVYGMRNDTMASFLGADLTVRPIATDSAGRLLTKPFISDDIATRISFTGSTVSTSVMLVQASAVGKKNYVTDFWIANTGGNSTLITFKDGSTSILGYAMAPAGGGSNSPGIHVPFRTNTSQDLTIVPTTASSVIWVTVQGYQAP